MKTLQDIQHEIEDWSDHNFPSETAWEGLVCLIEELGEIAHSHLKLFQGTRTNEDHPAKLRDAIGDTVIALAHYCSLQGIDLQEVTEATWRKVRERDWQADPVHGGELQ